MQLDDLKIHDSFNNGGMWDVFIHHFAGCPQAKRACSLGTVVPHQINDLDIEIVKE